MSSNSAKVSAAFSKQARVFDELSEKNKLSVHLRSEFRNEVSKHLLAQSEILELNCGTGLDAAYFASMGHRVLATDNAPGMVEEVEKKISENKLSDFLKSERLSFHELEKLRGRKFDHVISNFGGLNCSENLAEVLLQLPPLLKPGGTITLAIMPKISPWEIIQAVRGKFGTAFRRFGKSAVATIEGINFNCYYYNPSYIVKALAREFDTISIKGIFITLPPEFYHNFVEKHPRLYSILSRIDALLGNIFPFNRLCDHFIITLKKKS